MLINEISFDVNLIGNKDGNSDDDKNHSINAEHIEHVGDVFSKVLNSVIIVSDEIEDYFVINFSGELFVEKRSNKESIPDRFLRFIKQRLEVNEEAYYYEEKRIRMRVKIGMTWCEVKFRGLVDRIECARVEDVA